MNRYNRPGTSRSRQRALRKRRLIAAGSALSAILVIVLVIALLPKGGEQDREVDAVPAVEDVAVTEAPETETAEEGAQNTAEEAAVQSTPQPAVQSDAAEAARRAQTRPTPTAAGFMPVFSKANTDEKIIAITVDDCNQANNLEQIVNKALEVGGKLTIFPIGENVLKEKQSQILKYAWENGFELENHTFTHNGLFYATNEELAEEVYKQQLALSSILGVEYQCHFLRPRGGDARGDQRMQMYAKQMGYYGIAHWSVSGSASKSKIAQGLGPGAIFLFHTTDKDLEKLLQFIPWAVEQGYQLVTLNEMFGYPANETSELITPIEEHVIPPLEPYEMVYVTLKKRTFNWEAYLLQEKLIELGYLTGEPDGEYGEGSEAAIKAYQKDHGLEQNGVVDPDLARTIIEGAEA